MKKTISLLIFCSIVANTFAQQKFDITTYKIGTGWKKENTSNNTAVQLSTTNATTGTYCIITLGKASATSGNALNDFKTLWQSSVTETVGAALPTDADITTEKQTDGRTYVTGASAFKNEGADNALIFVTSSSNNNTVPILIVANSTEFETDIDAFLNSLSFAKTTVQNSAAVTTNTTSNNSQKPSSIIGEWLYDDAMISVLYEGADPYNNNVKMSIKNKLTFFANGSYEDYTFYNKGSFTKREITKKGTYSISGNQITFKPTNSIYKKNDQLQPNSANSLKASSAFIEFVFDDKANAWGIKLTATDDDGFFPEEVYLKSDAYKLKTANKNLNSNSPSNNLATQSGNGKSNYSLNGSGIVGLWQVLTYDYINKNTTFMHQAFFANGQTIETCPVNGFFQFNGANTENVTLLPYTFNNNKGMIISEQYGNSTLEKLDNNRLKIGTVTYFKCVNVDGAKLSGTYASIDWEGGNICQDNGTKTIIHFNKNGTFTDEGFWAYVEGKGTNYKPENAPGKGSYEIKEFTIFLNYEDGHKKTVAFNFSLNTTLQSHKMVFIDGRKLHKLK